VQLNQAAKHDEVRGVALRPNLNLSQADQLGYIYLPNEGFDKGVFLFMSEDGKFSTVKLKEEDLVMYGRCPSQGRDSALPMKVRRVETGVFSMRVPLDVCNMNNTDFDGDEAWVIKGGSKDGVGGVRAREHLLEDDQVSQRGGW
jgi:DNA-directed RNA polymerase beta' subunit